MTTTQAPIQMLYISRLMPDMRNRTARQLIGRPRSLYAVLLEAFQADAITHHQERGSDPRGLLFRIEQPTREIPASIIVQSLAEPDWSRLPGPRFLQPITGAETKCITPQPETGQALRFRIRANPTKSDPKTKTSNGKRGKVVGIVKEPEQQEWLLRKLSHAAQIDDIRMIDEGWRMADGTGGRRSNQIVSALFEGILIVKDPAELLRHMATGIGRARSQGYGLLSLARV